MEERHGSHATVKERSRSISLVDSQPLKVKVKVTQSCPILCDPMDYTVHEILQARIQPIPSPGDFPYPGIEPRSPALLEDSLPAEP